jgi:hypothetical protein
VKQTEQGVVTLSPEYKTRCTVVKMKKLKKGKPKQQTFCHAWLVEQVRKVREQAIRGAGGSQPLVPSDNTLDANNKSAALGSFRPSIDRAVQARRSCGQIK